MAGRVFNVIAIILILVILAGAALSNWKILGHLIFGDVPSEIKHGFSADLTKMLSQQYGLHIPDQAKFTDGCYTNGFRDAYIFITFEIDISELTHEAEDFIEDQKRQDGSIGQAIRSKLLEDEKWSRHSGAACEFWMEVNDTLNSDVVYTRQFTCLAVDFTSLFYNISDAGSVQFCFVGWRPLDAEGGAL